MSRQVVPRPFSRDYFESCGRFRDAAERTGAEFFRKEISARGPQGETLSIDLARVGAADCQGKVLIHTSGLHGVEGFVGAAIQEDLLLNLPSVSNGDSVLFIHAINPFGMAWGRRWNENNVDLNRNFIDSADEPVDEPAGEFAGELAGEHASQSTEGLSGKFEGVSDAYRRVHHLLNPAFPPTRWEPFRLKAAGAIARDGFQQLKQAIAEGQYEFPQGLFFGGRELEESTRVVFECIDKLCRSASQMTLIDVHSGLGRYGRDTLFTRSDPDSPTRKSLGAAFGNRVESQHDSEIAYKIRGGFLDAVEALNRQRDCLTICQEFGTYGPLRMLSALRSENRWHHFGGGQIPGGNKSDGSDRDGEARYLNHWSKRALLDAFCPSDPVWQQEVLKRGRELFSIVQTMTVG